MIRRFIPASFLSWYHYMLALGAAFIYRFPSRHIVVIGVTGTNGKSTVVDLTHRIFARAGYRVASASSLRFIIADEEKRNTLKMTMPGRFFTQKFLRDAVRAKCDVAILEVTSEGIRQFRHAFIQFDGAALTNITPEHLESHGGFENYRREKLKLFQAISRSRKRGKMIVINGDDPSADLFLRHHASQAWIYGLKPASWHKIGTVISPQSYALHNDGVRFVLQSMDFSLRLLGKFNLYNALCAYAIAASRGVSPSIIRDALEDARGVPGRLEIVAHPPDVPYSVIVDYAHTPDALSNIYDAIGGEEKRLICVLGSAGGGRDKWKRPEMGKIADMHCAEIFLTNEDPYDEDPMRIIYDVARGIKKKPPHIVLDRREAITEAIKKARVGDTVIITGKGAESVMVVSGGKRIPWDDRSVVREALTSLREGNNSVS